MATELSIIVVSYNSKTYLEQCLFSLQKALAGIAAEIIVVDNDSKDGTAHWLKTAFPDVIALPLSENLGYARANNLGLTRATGKHILFLNPDTLLGERCIALCLSFMNGHPEAGALGVRMIDGFGRFLRESKRGWPGSRASLYKFLGLADRFPANAGFSSYYAPGVPDHSLGPVPVLSGAFLMVRKESIERTGGFDEQFFMFGEDIDLSCRILQQGWKNYYMGTEVIVHFKGHSTDRDSAAYRAHFYGAMSLFVKKYYRGPGSFFYRPLLLAGVALQKARARAVQGRSQGPCADRHPAVYMVVGSGRDTRAFLEKNETAGAVFEVFDSQIIPLSELGKQLKSGGPLSVLFCLGDLGYEEAIRWLDHYDLNVPCYFHHAGSESVAGPGKEWPGPLRGRLPG